MKAPDGTLLDWREIETAYPWDTLLLGNGLSVNVWKPFGYRSLYDRAEQSGLSRAERRLFAETPNFERVLGDLLTAVEVNKALGLETKALLSEYRSIQRALAHAIKDVHVNRERVPLATRREIRRQLLEFEWIFTTSYDLMIYWSMGCERRFAPFMDHFRYGKRCEFDPARARAPAKSIPVYFLHGALHLVVGESGKTWKLRQNLDSLLAQFGRPIDGDPTARPLLVTEGSAADKLFAIERNVYLSHALDRLAERELPVVVFGSSLSGHDAHLADALNEHPDRPVAVSMVADSEEALLAKQVEIFGRLKAQPLLFFDASTHPLGDPQLNIDAPS